MTEFRCKLWFWSIHSLESEYVLPVQHCLCSSGGFEVAWWLHPGRFWAELPAAWWTLECWAGTGQLAPTGLPVTHKIDLDFVDQTGWQLLQVVLWLTMGCCEVAFETRILFNLWFWTEMQVYSYEIKLKHKKQNKPKTMVVTIKQNL